MGYVNSRSHETTHVRFVKHCSHNDLTLFMPKPNTESKVDELRESVAKSIRMARADRRLSQIEVARQAGTSPGRVSELESGKSDPRLSTLIRIAGALGLDVRVESAA
jgi:DNA-binding XRE family transcriptional regulator